MASIASCALLAQAGTAPSDSTAAGGGVTTVGVGVVASSIRSKATQTADKLLGHPPLPELQPAVGTRSGSGVCACTAPILETAEPTLSPSLTTVDTKLVLSGIS